MAVLFSTLLAAGALAGPAGGPAALGRLRATIARAPLIGMSENEAAKDDKRIGVGIIGAGRIGLVHLEALSSCPAARPVIISNPTISKAQAAAATYPGMAWTDSDMDVILHPDVDAVWICSPSQFHAQQITACAMAGKDIFCEKPIATELSETIKAVNLCREKGVKLMTALQRRFDPNFARVKKSIVDGTIGDLIVVKLCSRDPSPPPFKYVAGGGGIFKDMAIHDLDMARFLMDSEPVAVLATGSCQISPEIKDLPGAEAYDTANIMVRFANGKEAIIDVCRQAPYGYDQRAEVLGSKGMLMTDNMFPNTARIMSNKFCGNADMPFDFFMSRYKEAYKQETIAFVEALQQGKPAPCSGRDGLVALIMAIAAGISAEEQRWVQFDEVLRREGIGGMKRPDMSEGVVQGSGWIASALLDVASRDPRRMEDLQELFYLFDTDEDGQLSGSQVAETVQLLCKDGACQLYSDDEVRAMVGLVDRNWDGKINFNEFTQMWRKAGNVIEGEEPQAEETGLAKLFAMFK